MYGEVEESGGGAWVGCDCARVAKGQKHEITSVSSLPGAVAKNGGRGRGEGRYQVRCISAAVVLCVCVVLEPWLT